MPSWHGAQLKKQHRDNFTFTLSLFEQFIIHIFNEHTKCLLQPQNKLFYTKLLNHIHKSPMLPLAAQKHQFNY